MGEFATISPGDDPLQLLTSARWLNAVSAVASGGVGGGPSGGGSADGGRMPLFCKIKNTSDTDVPRYGVLGIDAPLINKTDNEKYFLGPVLQFKGVKPTQEHVGRLAFCLGPIKQGKIGDAIIPCAVQTKVDIVEATHRHANIIDDDVAKLKSGASGTFPMVPGETGTGVKWAVVFMGPGGGGGLNLGGGITSSIQLGFLVKQIPARTVGITYSGELVNSISVAAGGDGDEDAAIPMINDGGGFHNDLWPDDHPTKAGQIKRMKAVNHCWDWKIFAGNGKADGAGNANMQPIWALGYVTKDPDDEWDLTFNVIWIDNPTTLMEALTTAAVAGGGFNVDTVNVLWGLKHKASKFNGVGNPGAWHSGDNARCLITRDVETNALVAIDLACP